MEVAIPIIALAGAYVISNQSKNSDVSQKNRLEKGLQRIQNGAFKVGNQENFQNMGARSNYLPNTEIPTQNYPVTNFTELNDNVKNYDNPNSATDKYFNQNYFENKQNEGSRVGNNLQEVYSLTGNYLDSKEFKHNNMIPFYGAKIKGKVYDMGVNESILDNMIGSGSQTIKKVEQAPLFKPQDNVQWAYGAPNMSDFYQSRVNPGKNNAMVKPFITENVGPGLNQGYGTLGSGGYNSGMESRDSWLPKTVDELRVATNPKMEYSLDNHQGPSYSHVQNVGILGKVEKYHPDTFFINSQDRWLTTTGQEKGQTLRSVQEDRFTNRKTTTQEYAGVASAAEKNAPYATPAFTPAKRTELAETDVPAAYAGGRGPGNEDRDEKSYTNYANNRSTVRQPDTFRSLFNSAIGAVVAPIMDIVRPSKKDEYSANIRIYGDVGSSVPKNYVLNKGDVPVTTIRQTTLYTPDTYIGNQYNMGYVLQNNQPIENQRDSTSCSYIGSGGNGLYGPYNTDSAYRQHNNERLEATQKSYTPQGSTQLFNPVTNLNCARIDTDRENPRSWTPAPGPNGTLQMPPSKENYGNITHRQQYNENKIGCERISPDILNAFRSNPYTHSLTDSV
jgi:hypothetical protein